MENHDIIIFNGNPQNGKLDLGSKDEIHVDTDDTVSWSIASGANVVSFKIEKKLLSRKIFTEGPPEDHRPKVKMQVRNDVGGRKYKYSIHWKENNTQQEDYIYDPKISVNPSDDGYMNLFLGLAVGLVATVLTLSFLNRKRNRR